MINRPDYRIYLLAVILILLSVAALVAQDTFDTKTDFSVGGFPISVSPIDFNGDGNNDLAIANTYSDNISILFGNGDGTFQDAINYVVGKSPRSVFSFDLNGDGNNDLITANSAANSVTILLNKFDPDLWWKICYWLGW